jgi:tRNA(fMet)-specific endonuclease VapC
MTRYVLDTDILTLFQLGNPEVLRHVQECSSGQLAITIISVEEELRGWYTKVRQAKKPDQLARAYQHLTDAIRFLANLELLSFTEPAIARYEGLRKSHSTKGKNDLRIAAIVLEHGNTLVTRNVSDFQAIPGLTIEDWSKLSARTN